MEITTNVKKVSLIFFLILTGTHLVSALLVAKGYGNATFLFLYRTLDLPAILAGIIYGASSGKEYLLNIGKNTKIFDVVAGVTGSIILITALYLNFLL